ncbi:MAG: MFS transporter [Pseudomonadota bacterium]
MTAGTVAQDNDTLIFGHPAGLMTLFFTEMWERFSYYGMRALLVLYMTDSARRGLAIDTETAGAIYGLYTFGVYALALPGGWIADRFLGQRRTILIGGIVIAAGFFVLAWGALRLPEDAAASPGTGAAVTWLVVTYFFHTVGELALSPVGLSSVTKLAPRRLVGQMMGTWFMGTALGNLLAGLVAGQIATLPPSQLFAVSASIAAGTGVVFMLCAPLIKRMMHGIR